MKIIPVVKKIFFILLCCITMLTAFSQRITTLLNGQWDFEQTNEALPPKIYTRKIAVPGLINAAVPRVENYDSLFTRKFDHGARPRARLVKILPKYNWYKKKLFITKDQSGLNAVLTLLKSQYVTQVFINGLDLGTYTNCSTPINVNITKALKYGHETEILIKLDDHQRLPSSVPGGWDAERDTYMSGIWDDVFISFSKSFRVDKLLVLPSLKKEKIVVKYKVWNFIEARTGFGFAEKDSVTASLFIKEKSTEKQVAHMVEEIAVRGDAIEPFEMEVDIKKPHAWNLNDPFLYTAELQLINDDKVSDSYTRQFGMRDFERRGKYFYLNDKKIMLRGANIGLHRFFSDPDVERLPWNKEWVKKLLIDIPKKLQWNAMRNTIGLLRDFWYDMADENGLLLQNEWEYWQAHGWYEPQRKEYTDWVWSDGSHPSIVIWDAMNEFKDSFVGNELIPELKKLDPYQTLG